jgi:hypothetical protein
MLPMTWSNIYNAADDMVKLVEDLVVSQIQGTSLILVALPMTGEYFPSNSQGVFPALTIRTIDFLLKPSSISTPGKGVLTKPSSACPISAVFNLWHSYSLKLHGDFPSASDTHQAFPYGH